MSNSFVCSTIDVAVRCIISAFLVVGAGASRAGAATAQEVEIISGAPAAAPAARGPGIRVIAFVGPDSGAAEYAVVVPPLADEILLVQRALAGAGYEPGVRDGVLGPETAAALSSFQADRGLEPCGCIDYPTAMDLGFEPRVTQTVLGMREDEPAPEIVMPSGRLTPRSPPAPPPADTVVMVRETGRDWWSYGPIPGLSVLGIPVGSLQGPPVTGTRDVPGGIPFGGSATRGRGSIRTVRPPPR